MFSRRNVVMIRCPPVFRIMLLLRCLRFRINPEVFIEVMSWPEFFMMTFIFMIWVNSLNIAMPVKLAMDVFVVVLMLRVVVVIMSIMWVLVVICVMVNVMVLMWIVVVFNLMLNVVFIEYLFVVMVRALFEMSM